MTAFHVRLQPPLTVLAKQGYYHFADQTPESQGHTPRSHSCQWQNKYLNPTLSWVRTPWAHPRAVATAATSRGALDASDSELFIIYAPHALPKVPVTSWRDVCTEGATENRKHRGLGAAKGQQDRGQGGSCVLGPVPPPTLLASTAPTPRPTVVTS